VRRVLATLAILAGLAAGLWLLTRNSRLPHSNGLPEPSPNPPSAPTTLESPSSPEWVAIESERTAQASAARPAAESRVESEEDTPTQGPATIAGFVSDPRGVPLAGASLFCFDSNEWIARDDPVAVTISDGTFRCELPSGHSRLRAAKEGFGPSEFLQVELVPFEERRDLALRLRYGGTIVGEVIDDVGRPIEKAWVTCSSEREAELAALHFDSTFSDTRGRFELVDMPASVYGVTAILRQGGLELRASVQVIEGETVHVRLAPSAGLTRLHGRVTFGGEPREQTKVSAQGCEPPASNSSFTLDLARSWCAADGSYELLVPQDNICWFQIESGNLTWSSEIEVPPVAEHVFDLDLALGHIRGTVRAPDGSPIAGVQMAAFPGPRRAWGVHEGITDFDGHYDLEVIAGLLNVEAGATRTWKGARPVRALLRRSDLSVQAGQVLDSINFVLGEAPVLRGVAQLEDGSPLAGAGLYILDGAGWRLHGLSRGDGFFELDELAPGTVTIAATTERLSTRQGVSVQVFEGVNTETELVLLPRIPASVRVRDEAGDEPLQLAWTDDLGTVQELELVPGQDLSLGQVFPGRHFFTLRGGERVVERLVIVRGSEAEVLVELAFD